ncbi:MAG TPA: threonine--tRNA ligase [Candidatus Lokiarchaeia archaeon]|nr:threonine--tRNA ligase [Candidatus Lokiarchaeia archaeon]
MSVDLNTLRHSASHILALAVKRLFPNVKFGIGPATDEGFYYDFDSDYTFTTEDLETIETEMKKIIEEDLPFERREISAEEARELFASEPYKLELIDEYENEGKTLSYYTLGPEWCDLCAGPHVESSSAVPAVKLLNLAGAYWKGDAKNKALQRVYGTAYPTEEELANYLAIREEALKRDHQKLGRKMGLFLTAPVVGQGLPIMTPKGTKIEMILRRWVEDTEEAWGYQQTLTPYLAKSDLYKISGHWDHYRENMFVLQGYEGDMALRPMTCPFQYMIYLNEAHSYRDLPVRLAETSTLFRNEASGEMHGLTRLRQFTLADAHIICRPDQVEDEFERVLKLVLYIMDTLGIKDFWYRFSKWDPENKSGKYIDNPDAWNATEASLKSILDKLQLKYDEVADEAAFYGPKLDIQMRNVWGKEDTYFTIQIDFAAAENFDLFYFDENGQKVRPFVIHRSSIGCYERTMAYLIEQYAGKFPLWLSPEQVRILPIADRHNEFCQQAKEQMVKAGLRVTVDENAQPLKKKIRNAQLDYVNFILVVGDKEVEEEAVNVRTRDNEVHGTKPVGDFIQELTQYVNEKNLTV